MVRPYPKGYFVEVKVVNDSASFYGYNTESETHVIEIILDYHSLQQGGN
jgi:hypothetical protein|tara:strand:- start:3890 stop:4036 length:147 start_codon:yes stop_codon:yes gene_type:complete